MVFSVLLFTKGLKNRLRLLLTKKQPELNLKQLVSLNKFLKHKLLQTIELKGGPIDRRQAYGRIAFSCPYAEQEPLSDHITKHNQTILTPLLKLPTPGKQTVRVLILADPDGHEICFVEDEGYRKLSEPDFPSEKVLDLQIQKDKS